MAGRGARADAERAALASLRQDLKARAQLVGAAVETQARIGELFEQMRTAIVEHETAYAAAVAGGWTRAKLTELGVLADPAGRVRRALPSASSSSTDSAKKPGEGGTSAAAPA